MTKRGIFAFLGLTIGAAAFGMWQHSVWAAVFIFAAEYGVHYEATHNKAPAPKRLGRLTRFWEI